MLEEEFLKELKAINDNTRLTIIKLLSNNGTMCACKILDELKITQGTLSHHMKVLCDVNLVACKKVGKWCHYTLNRESLNEISKFITNIGGTGTKSNDNNCSCCNK